MARSQTQFKPIAKASDFLFCKGKDQPLPYGGDHPLARAHTLRAKEVVQNFPGYHPTPLVHLNEGANLAGVEALYYKDESRRFTLKNFKAVGGAYAVLELVRKLGKDITITSSTAGSHGRSIAWGAKMAGIDCVIYISESVTSGRQKAMEELDAKVIRVPGLYDNAFKAAREAADKNGWIMVCDTTFKDYEKIPYTIMQGYGVLAEEMADQLDQDFGHAIQDLTHVFLQAGCGGFAAAIMAAMINLCRDKRPRFILVEPDKAPCVLESLKKDRPIFLDGDISTFMGGLEVAEVSMAAWPIFKDYCDAAISIADQDVPPFMRALALAELGQAPIEAGESSAAGLVGAFAALKNPELKEKLGLNSKSRILTIGTEGASCPETFEAFTGLKAWL